MDEFVITRPDGSEIQIGGYRFAAPREDAKLFDEAGSRLERLPAKADLRPYMTRIEDQGRLSSCVANAVAGAYEYLVKRHQGDDAYDVSRLFIYYNARQVGGSEHEDQGAVIGDAIQSLSDHGACSETTWPYEEARVNETPSEQAYEEGQAFVVQDVQQVPTTLPAWKTCLAEGHPIIFGLLLFKSFDSHRKRGVVPVPSPSEASRESHGGHAMLCVGYSDPDRVFVVRNSWGSGWGDGGYCYVPYDYMMNEKFNGGDSWIINRLESFAVDEDLWGDDQERILEDVETELGQMDDDQYREMLDAFGDVPFEHRLALVFLRGAASDSEISEEEIEEISAYLARVFDQMGSPYDAARVIRACMDRLQDEELILESVGYLGQYLSRSALAGMVSTMQEVVGVDGLSEGEEDFIWGLVQAWQVEEGVGGEGEVDSYFDHDGEDSYLSDEGSPFDEGDPDYYDDEEGRDPEDDDD
jgi:hypothetical protein